jgi:hypothetical protein
MRQTSAVSESIGFLTKLSKLSKLSKLLTATVCNAGRYTPWLGARSASNSIANGPQGDCHE